MDILWILIIENENGKINAQFNKHLHKQKMIKKLEQQFSGQ